VHCPSSTTDPDSIEVPSSETHGHSETGTHVLDSSSFTVPSGHEQHFPLASGSADDWQATPFRMSEQVLVHVQNPYSSPSPQVGGASVVTGVVVWGMQTGQQTPDTCTSIMPLSSSQAISSHAFISHVTSLLKQAQVSQLPCAHVVLGS
jgi:hypothetical protein